MNGSIQRLLRGGEMSADQEWAITEWCHSLGGEEFTLSTLTVNDPTQPDCQTLALLKPFSKDEAIRETVYCRRERVPLWSLTPASLAILRQLLPEGIFTCLSHEPTWIENFTIYRHGEMLLGVLSHEGCACLRLTDSEWQRFNLLGIPTQESMA